MDGRCPSCQAVGRLSEEAGVQVCLQCGRVVEPVQLEMARGGASWTGQVWQNTGKGDVGQHKFRAPRTKPENALQHRRKVVMEACGRLNLPKGCTQRAVQGLERAMNGSGWKETKLPLRAMAAAAAMRAAREDGLPLSLREAAEAAHVKPKLLAQCDLQMRKIEAMSEVGPCTSSGQRGKQEQKDRKPGAEDFAKRALADVIHEAGMDRTKLQSAIQKAMVVLDYFENRVGGMEGRIPNAIGAAAACLALPGHEKALLLSVGAAPSTVQLRKKEMETALLEAAALACAGDVQMALAYAVAKSHAEDQSKEKEKKDPLQRVQGVQGENPPAFQKREQERQRKREKAKRALACIKKGREGKSMQEGMSSGAMWDWEDLLFTRLLMAGATVDQLVDTEDYKRLPPSLLKRAGVSGGKGGESGDSLLFTDTAKEETPSSGEDGEGIDAHLRTQEEVHLATQLQDAWE